MKPNGKPINLEEMGDDEMLHLFMRKALPELWSELEPYHSRLKAGEKLSIIELFGMFELWRQHMSFVWAAHSPRQQPAFENFIRDDWIAVREAQHCIYEKVEREYEKRKAAQ
jgi:hypothetical protein